MNSRNLVRNLAALAVLMTVTCVVAMPALAQKTKPAVKSAKTAAATLYECKECKLKFTAAEAKKKHFKCDCGCKLTVVKTAKKAEPKKKS